MADKKQKQTNVEKKEKVVDTTEHTEKTEKKEKKYPNEATFKAGLVFNVNPFKTKLQETYNSQGINMPVFTNGHVVMSAIIQKLFEYTLQECVKNIAKDKSGVRQVNREGLQYSVLLNRDLKHYFLSYLDQYDPNDLYKELVPVSTEEMDKVMGMVDKDLSLTPQARNLLHFLLGKAFSDVAASSVHFLNFAKRSSLDGRCLTGVVLCKFRDTVAQTLQVEIARVMKTSEKDSADENTAVEAEDDTQNNASQETENKKKESKPKVNSDKKKTANTINSEEVDEHVDAEQATEEEEEEQEEQNNEEEEQQSAPEPVQPKKKTTNSKPTSSGSGNANKKNTKPKN